ncbi:uncharacterized protein [Haliotis cracherodii]|uniref:uncharacterized protein n=1 Tax=Haliotis cracherodii TaxID=6455 RepID=UPI0039ECBC7E
MYAAYASTLLLITHLSHCAAELKCPELGYIGSKASLTCIGASTTHAYSKPSGSTASTCGVTSQQCINTGDDTGTVINETQTVLTISIVKKSDAGEWGCTLGSEPTPSKCSMTIAKLPSCNITSVPSPDELRVNQNVSLSVNAAGYYCSTGMKLQLRTGSNVTELTKGNLDAITDDSFQRQLNLTESYFGNVTLEFTCDSKQKDISCSGIQSLMPKQVTADKDSRSTNISTAVIIVVSCVAVTIIVVPVVVLVKMKCLKRTEQQKTKGITM